MSDREKVVKGLEKCATQETIEGTIEETREEWPNEALPLIEGTIEGTIEETREEWPNEALPLSCNETREYPVDNS